MGVAGPATFRKTDESYEGCVQKSGDIRGTCTYNLASGPYEKPGKPCKP
jgi:hypothetical protein